MKVLWFHSGVGATGGGFKAMLYMLNALRRKSVQLTVVCTEQSDVVKELEERQFPVILDQSIRKWPTTIMSSSLWTLDGIRNLFVWLITWRSSVEAARRVINTEQPDIVHINMAPLVPAAVAARIEGVPVVWHIREALNIRGVPIEAALNRRAIRRFSDYVISINEQNLHQLGDLSSCAVIRDSVMFEEFDRRIDGSEFRRSLRCSDNAVLVGVLNHVAWIKGTLEYARAAKLCLQKDQKLMFLVIGEYDSPARSLKQRVRRRVARMLRIPRYIERVYKEIHEERDRGLFKFIGPLMDVRQALAALDVLVFPAMTSHSPLPAIEAAAMAKPVVAADWPAVREVVTHGTNGFLFPPGDHEALSSAILTLANDAKLRTRLGENNYQTALARFDLQKNIEKVLSIYREVLA